MRFSLCKSIGMKLKNYIQKIGKKQIQVAIELDISNTHLSHILSGKRKPSADLIIKIEQWSKKKVTLYDLR